MQSSRTFCAFGEDCIVHHLLTGLHIAPSITAEGDHDAGFLFVCQANFCCMMTSKLSPMTETGVSQRHC